VGRIAAAVTAVYSAGNDLFVAQAGHCRCYLFRGGMLTQLTRDQTLRARPRATPQPTPVARALEDVEHILTSAIGAGGNGLSVIAEHFRLADDDTPAALHQRLTDMVSDAHIADALASRRTPQEQCDLLVGRGARQRRHRQRDRRPPRTTTSLIRGDGS
jgi:serine/threonine protein phosphatase PrpC